MLKLSIALGAAAVLAAPSVAAAQTPPPGPPPPGPPSGTPAQDLDEPPPPPGAPPRAPRPRGGPPEPEQPRPDRSGATFEMSLGFGMTHVSLDSGPSELFGGLSGLNLGLGGWISPRTALTLRIAGTSFSEDVGGTSVRFIAGLFGLSVQHMATDVLWLGLGGGLGVLSTDQGNVKPETGFGLDLRAGVNFHQTSKSAFHLAVEITPGFYDGVNVTGIGVQLGWQSL